MRAADLTPREAQAVLEEIAMEPGHSRVSRDLSRLLLVLLHRTHPQLPVQLDAGERAEVVARIRGAA